MEKRWILVFDSYEGMYKQAVNTLSGVVSGYLDYVLPVKSVDTVSDEELRESNLIVIGRGETNRLLRECEGRKWINVPAQAESYSVYVGQSVLDPQKRMIAIAGFDGPGLFYGCMDFCNRYCGNQLYQEGYLMSRVFFDNRFEEKLPDWQVSRSPAIKTRALWTWGHVIYDYRAFFDNMAKLRLNEVVIWNDHVPLNANDVVDYAHSLGIKVIWGFAWGWENKCEEHVKSFDFDSLPQLKESVLQTYEKQYANTSGDGIYFQSFTEMSEDSVGGKCIAQIVTELVNDISGVLLERHPGLHIQFGLHATSVRTKLDILKAVDKRVHIVWEDCGDFPYHYSTGETKNFPETLQFTRQLLTLRGSDERFGAVLKGMLNLDWYTFEHFTDSYILGERTNHYLKNRQMAKDRIWKIVQAGWLKNAECVRSTVALMAQEGHEPIVQALVEDAMFENEIPFPVALYAELLWTPEANLNELIEEVAKFPCVYFANA